MKHLTGKDASSSGSPGRPAHGHLSFGGNIADPDMVRFVVGITLAVLIVVTALVYRPVDLLVGRSSPEEEVRVIAVASSRELVDQLKDLGLWEVETESEIPAVEFSGFPKDFGTLSPHTKKKAFLHTLLPVALVALAEVEQEREALSLVLGKIGCDPLGFFITGEEEWMRNLNPDEIFFLERLSRKYRTVQVKELLDRVNTVPVSLILAQGALESSWGTSRFVIEGNNIFGIWTWGERGMIPTRRDDGKTHKVAAYDTILESVRAYLLMLNRLAPYRKLREIRRQTMDPFSLAQGLLYYSEKRDGYVADIRQVIRANGLEKYDRCVLSPVQKAGLAAIVQSPEG